MGFSPAFKGYNEKKVEITRASSADEG